MKYDVDTFYKHYGFLLDQLSTILDLQESYAYVKSYIWNILYVLTTKRSNLLLYNMDITPYSFTYNKYLEIDISGLILHHFDEDLVDPMIELMDKYPLLKEFFAFNGRKDFNTFVYTFKISSYQKLQQLDVLLKLMQRRDT